jgi:outer membrane protein OmpA-like peptidoglycan-associated protein
MEKQNALKKFFIFLMLFVSQHFIAGNIEAQDPKVFRDLFRNAEAHFIEKEYHSALDVYKQILPLDSLNSNIHFLTGYCYMKIGSSPALQIRHFEKAVLSINEYYREGSHFETAAPPLAFFLLGKSYLRNYEFDKAIEAFNKYKSLLDKLSFAEIEYTNMFINSSELAREMVKNPRRVEFIPLSHTRIEGKSVSHPVISGDGSVMVMRITGSEGTQTAMLQEKDDVWSGPVIIDDQLDMPDSYYPTSLSWDGKELYLVSTSGFTPDIYTSVYDGASWSEAKSIGSPINTGYSETHASISADNQTLYFTSDRKNGWGGMDIYMSVRNERGRWSKPENLGAEINTYYQEETPFILGNDSILYFSSEGHETIGGFDVFTAQKNKDGTFSDVRNLGYPISTPGDDLFYNPGWDENMNYYARGRESNESTDGIYAVVWLEEEDTVTLTGPGSILAEAESVSTAGGIPPTVNQAVTETAASSAEKTIRVTDPEKKDGTYYYVSGRILFDYNSTALSEEAEKEVSYVADMMKTYRDISIELVGHTDSKGSSAYNAMLSEKRAMGVKDYLVGKGVSGDRIKVVAAGEHNPVAINTYADGTDAPRGRALNRNVSVRIDKQGQDRVRLAEIFVPLHLVPEQDKVYSILLMETFDFNDTIPLFLYDRDITLILTGTSVMYTLDNFETRSEAQEALETVIDEGYSEAGVIENRRFEQVVEERSAEDEGRSEGERSAAGFTIQIMALKSPVDISYFNQLEGVRVMKGTDGIYRYVYGTYSRINDARSRLKEVREKGFKEAFIRPCDYYDSIRAE